MNSQTPRQLAAADHPLHSDLKAAEIDRRFQMALKAIKASRQFTLDPDARKASETHPVRLGVSAHQGAFR